MAGICQKYLIRVQKSVFEGDLTKSQLISLKKEIKKYIKRGEDSVIIYFLRRASMRKKIYYGKTLGDPYIIF